MNLLIVCSIGNRLRHQCREKKLLLRFDLKQKWKFFKTLRIHAGYTNNCREATWMSLQVPKQTTVHSVFKSKTRIHICLLFPPRSILSFEPLRRRRIVTLYIVQIRNITIKSRIQHTDESNTGESLYVRFSSLLLFFKLSSSSVSLSFLGSDATRFYRFIVNFHFFRWWKAVRYVFCVLVSVSSYTCSSSSMHPREILVPIDCLR